MIRKADLTKPTGPTAAWALFLYMRAQVRSLTLYDLLFRNWLAVAIPLRDNPQVLQAIVGHM